MSSNKSTFWSRKKCIDSTVVLYLSSELDLEFLARIWVGFTIFEIVKSEDHLIIHFTNYSWQPSLNWEISFEQLAPCLGSFFTNTFFLSTFTTGWDRELKKYFKNFVFGFFMKALSLPCGKIISKNMNWKKYLSKEGAFIKQFIWKRYGFYPCEK